MFAIPLAARYALFAGAATLTNLAAQTAALRVYRGPMALTVAIGLGTGAGLLIKYALDKQWIFFDRARGVAAHGKRFTLYAVTGAATTALFWSAEYAFDALTADGRYRFIGAVIGLSAGYLAKYQLDRRFVFRETPA